MPQSNITPLHLAAMRGSANLIRKLSAGGVATSATDGYGWTPLHVAAHKGNEAALTELLASTSEPKRWTLSVRPHALSAAALSSAQTQFTALHLACECPSDAAVRALIAAGHPIDEWDQQNRTPLAIASTYGEVATVEALLAAGADIQATSKVRAYSEKALRT